MSVVIEYALLADGTSDRALLPLIRWALRRARPEGSFAFQGFEARGGRDLAGAIQTAIHNYRPTILFVHRDAEGATLEQRREEIPQRSGVCPIVPVRMTEAWLLIDEGAVRSAADNPNGSSPLELPSVRRLESIVDAKATLRELLMSASENRGPRRRKRFEKGHSERMQRVAESIPDFRALLEVPAFARFCESLDAVLPPPA